jgi:CRISPR-associated endonuclease/helicase Cas3
VTEFFAGYLAPYASLVQRFGRCNRAGEFAEARIFWVELPLNEKDAKLAAKDVLDLHSAHCRKGLCSRVRQNLPPGYARLIDGYLRQLFIDL